MSNISKTIEQEKNVSKWRETQWKRTESVSSKNVSKYKTGMSQFLPIQISVISWLCGNQQAEIQLFVSILLNSVN